jgi:AraC-like DNA-binding protein
MSTQVPDIQLSVRAESPHGELISRVSRLAAHEGAHPTHIAPLTLIRYSSCSQSLASVYEPSLCIVVQGRKRAELGGDVYIYDALNYLVVSVTLPVIGAVIEASADAPYLCLRIALDRSVIAELLLQSQRAKASLRESRAQRGLFLASTDAAMLDAVLRLLRLLDEPDDAAVLAPMVLREIHYRVLVGELGPRLKELCVSDSQTQRVARAIDMLRTRYAEPVSIEELAEAAHMSQSSLHHRFKEVTAMSPVQFQKQLRLHEARRLMFTEGFEAARAAHRVGYESASQFSREYRRLFGAPPRQEIQTIRGEVNSQLTAG